MHVNGDKFLAYDCSLEARNGGLLLQELKIKGSRTTIKKRKKKLLNQMGFG